MTSFSRRLRSLVPAVAGPALKKIHRFHNAHRGESCYLMGDGVSLKWFDLSAFSDRTTIPCAFIPWHVDFAKLNVKYVSIQEPWWFLPWEKLYDGTERRIANPRSRKYRELFRKHPDKIFFANLSNYVLLTGANIQYTYQNFHDPGLDASFITNRIDAFHGSLRFSVSLAIYMGFSTISLVGYDYTHVPARNRHWYEKGTGNLRPPDDYNSDFFAIAREFADISTITVDGTSKVANAVTYKAHSGREPLYRENTELMDRAHLEVLATWPGYDIL